VKVYISADIEGCTTTTFWNETLPEKAEYSLYAQRMTEEVLAACVGANQAGASEIVVRDAHYHGNNIDISQLPANVKIIRGWSGHPYSMIEGMDDSFDAAVFIGYHSGASRPGNPLSHTYSPDALYVKLNGEVASEFTMYSYGALLEGVPTVFLAGDKMLCEDSKDLHPKLVTCPVKEGVGASTLNYNPVNTLKEIREKVKLSLEQDLKSCLGKLPGEFELEICYKEPGKAEKYSYYPGIEKINDNTLRFKSKDYFEVLRAFSFIN
jgi:D-amino peptidase